MHVFSLLVAWTFISILADLSNSQPDPLKLRKCDVKHRIKNSSVMPQLL